MTDRDAARRPVRLHAHLPRTRRLSRQIVALATITSLLAGSVLVAVVAVTASGLATRSADEVLSEVSNEAIATITRGPHESPVVTDQAVEPGVVIYDQTGHRIAGTPVRGLGPVYHSLASLTGTRTTEASDTIRVRASPFVSPSGARGIIVAATSLRGYDKAATFAIQVAVMAALLLVLVATLAAVLVSRQTWRRVSAMARTADIWSERDLERRFDVESTGHELEVLATTLNGLLDKVTHALGAEQRLTAELAHELRSPLAAAQGLTELLASRPDLDQTAHEDLAQLHAACTQLGATITTLLDLARYGPLPTGGVTRLRDLVDAVLTNASDRGRLEVPLTDAQSGVNLQGDRDLLLRALMPLVDNALRDGGRVRMTAESRPASRLLLVHVDDNGPGVAAALADDVFSPGVSTTGGAGLGLALARRVARSIGGEVELASPPPSWSTRFTVRLPSEGSTGGPRW